jgi:hypothetical protein
VSGAPHFVTRAAELAAAVIRIAAGGNGVSFRALLDAGFTAAEILTLGDTADNIARRMMLK